MISQLNLINMNWQIGSIIIIMNKEEEENPWKRITVPVVTFAFFISLVDKF